MTAARPTAPSPRIATVSAGWAPASSVMVPAPVWMPQPNGARILSWSSSSSSAVTLTTEASLALVTREKLDCPKKEPPTVCPAVSRSRLEKAALSPPKLICPHLEQYPGAPNWQLWHSWQKAMDSRTLSPFLTLVTFGPVDLMMPAPVRHVVSRQSVYANYRGEKRLGLELRTFVAEDSRVQGQAKRECLIRDAPADKVSVADPAGHHLHDDLIVRQGREGHLLEGPAPLAVLGRTTDDRLRLDLFAGGHNVTLPEECAKFRGF